MRNDETTTGPVVSEQGAPRPLRQRYVLHAVLFVVTFASITLAGLGYVSPSTATEATLVDYLPDALYFAVLVTAILTAHEFGHYIAARLHGVATTLPFFIPFPFLSPFGTMGAVIRLRSPIPNRRALFDIGVAGPLAGFVVALACLVVGMATMPGRESLLAIHPEYRGLSTLPAGGMHWGSFLLFDALKWLIVPRDAFFPPSNELYHYPLIAAGWFGMFITAVNMIPAGQLDGGHITYAMFGDRQKTIARWVYRGLMFIGIGGIGGIVLDATRAYNSDGLYQFLQRYLGPPLEWIAAHASWWYEGFAGWLIWAFIIRFFFRFAHPPVPEGEPLDAKRTIIGWFALAMFVAVFCYSGIYDR